MKRIIGGLLTVAVMLSGMAASAVTLTPEQIVKGGLTATYTVIQSALTYTFRNDGKTILHFKKSLTNSSTVTIVTPQTVNGLAVADLTFTLDSSGGRLFVGPFSRSLFEDGSGDITFTVTTTFGVTVAVLKL